MGLTWVLSAPGGPHVGPMNLAILDVMYHWVKAFPLRIEGMRPMGITMATTCSQPVKNWSHFEVGGYVDHIAYIPPV